MSEAALFATLSFPEIYERVLVGPLFTPFAEDLIARLRPAAQDSRRRRNPDDAAAPRDGPVARGDAAATATATAADAVDAALGRTRVVFEKRRKGSVDGIGRALALDRRQLFRPRMAVEQGFDIRDRPPAHLLVDRAHNAPLDFLVEALLEGA